MIIKSFFKYIFFFSSHKNCFLLRLCSFLRCVYIHILCCWLGICHILAIAFISTFAFVNICLIHIVVVIFVFFEYYFIVFGNYFFHVIHAAVTNIYYIFPDVFNILCFAKRFSNILKNTIPIFVFIALLLGGLK